MASVLISSYVIILLPNVVSLMAMAVVGSSRDKACLPTSMQPPGYVFAIVWPILYLLLGGAMHRVQGTTRALSALFALMLALNAWWIRFGNTCEPRTSLYAIIGVLCMALTVTWYVAQADRAAAAMLVPLVAWLCFATYLSTGALPRVHNGERESVKRSSS
jgi:tryptophan-rich sensory protein